jgi:hypothetical protein
MLEVKRVLTYFLFTGRDSSPDDTCHKSDAAGRGVEAAFDTPRVVRTGAVELTEWDLLASLMAITPNHSSDLRRSHSQEPPTSGCRKLSARSGSTMKHDLEHSMAAKRYESLGRSLKKKQAKTMAVKATGRQADATGPQRKQWDPSGGRGAIGRAGRRLVDAIIRWNLNERRSRRHCVMRVGQHGGRSEAISVHRTCQISQMQPVC